MYTRILKFPRVRIINSSTAVILQVKYHENVLEMVTILLCYVESRRLGKLVPLGDLEVCHFSARREDFG